MFDIVIVGHGRKKRLFIKSDIQLLFFEFVLVAQWRAMGFIFFCDRFTCVANLIVNFIPLFTDAERGERFQFHLQRPDVHREKGIWWAYIHAFFMSIYIYMFERRDFSCLSRFVNFHDNVWARSVAWETQEEWVFCNNLITFYGARTGVSPDCIPSIRDRRSSLPLPFKNSDDMKVFDPSCAKYLCVLLFLELNTNSF